MSNIKEFDDPPENCIDVYETDYTEAEEKAKEIFFVGSWMTGELTLARVPGSPGIVLYSFNPTYTHDVVMEGALALKSKTPILVSGAAAAALDYLKDIYAEATMRQKAQAILHGARIH